MSNTPRNHPFDGPEVFDDVPYGTVHAGERVLTDSEVKEIFNGLDPWPHVSTAIKAVKERRNA